MYELLSTVYEATVFDLIMVCALGFVIGVTVAMWYERRK